MLISGATQIGGNSNKESNQDDYAIWTDTDLISRKENMEKEVPVTSTKLYFAVADGVSAVKEAEKSSKMVIDSCLRATKNTNEITEIIDEVNSELSTKNKKYNPCYASTMTLAYICDNILHVRNIGDSPLVLYDGETISQITKNQTLAEWKKICDFDPEEIYEADYHTLLHYVGEKKSGSAISNHVERELKTGDVIFLSSDGMDINKAIEYYKQNNNCTAKDIIDNQCECSEDNLTLVLLKI